MRGQQLARRRGEAVLLFIVGQHIRSHTAVNLHQRGIRDRAILTFEASHTVAPFVFYGAKLDKGGRKEILINDRSSRF